LIEGKRCQVIPSRRGHPSKQYPYAEYFPLYLPRNDWADFLIYVSVTENPPTFCIIPRGEMSKHTGRAPASLEHYQDAWALLQQDLSESEKALEILSWQIEAIKRSAQDAGLEIELIKTKKHQDGRRGWPPVIKRRILIAGKRCAIFSASRISQDPEERGYNYVNFKVAQEAWSEFNIYVIKDIRNSSDIFVVPNTHLLNSTSASLDHPELARYKNAWNLLTVSPEALAAIPAIRWKEPKMPPAPTRHSIKKKVRIRR